jgi:polysaccharide export outer membrane protein
MRPDTARELLSRGSFMHWLRLSLALLFLPLAACAVNSTIPKSELAKPYELDAGDVVKVSVYGDETISRSYRVDESGNIAFPLVGSVLVRGKTTQQAAAAIAAGLANGYMRNPNVTAEIDTYRPFYISGSVKTPGQFAFVPGMTVRAAISTAGGFIDNETHAFITLYRTQAGQTFKAKVDMDFPIFAGDTIAIQ